MKGAETLPAATDTLELNMFGDDRDDVGGITNCSDVVVLDAHVTLRAGR
jgi:hypothetical protein